MAPKVNKFIATNLTTNYFQVLLLPYQDYFLFEP
jgi:hypothetical protein